MSNARYARARPRGRGIGAVHACTDDYERQAVELMTRAMKYPEGDPQRRRIERQFRKLGQRWSKSLRRAGGCDCGSVVFTWGPIEGPLLVRPFHLDGCKATEGRTTEPAPANVAWLPRPTD
ncbi:MAG: hypothetical protein KDB24_15505 [Microthrixaceae bacterium]|nr:hypothetical protein [Microthrixaceae bacterium]